MTWLLWHLDYQRLFCSVIALYFVSDVKKTYVREMVGWELKCIHNYLQDYRDARAKWLSNQEMVISFMKESGEELKNRRWHVRNTNYAGSSFGFVSTGLAISAVATLWFPPLSLGLAIGSGAVGAAGAVMNVGKINSVLKVQSKLQLTKDE